MSHTENQKNAKAGTYTGIVCGSLLLLFFIVSWSIPVPQQPQEELGMEVNLVNILGSLICKYLSIEAKPFSVNSLLTRP
jgi:hypothetical protein